MKSRPTHINFYDSTSDLALGKIQKLSVEEAEMRMAKHRNIPCFTWMENFADEKVVKKLSCKLINPNKIAICYFGGDIGYGTVAVEPIKEGEMLVFAGDEFSDLKEEDHHNPYLCQTDELTYISAKEKGGFASMLMDLPSETEIAALKKRSGCQADEVAKTNFDVLVYTFKNKKKVCVLLAKRDIQAKEIMGAAYALATRLMYTHYIGFYQNGSRLSPSMDEDLNHIIYKQLLYRDLSEQHKLLHKITKNINKSNINKAVNYLQQNIFNLKELNIDELNIDELMIIFSFLDASKKLAIRKTYSNPRDEFELLPNIFNEIWDRDEEVRTFFERALMELVIACNLKQIEFKGKSQLHLYDNCMENYYVIYPNIERDYFEIAKQHENRGSPKEVALGYYKASLFYGKKFNTSNQNFLDLVETECKRLTHG